jgi:hypothetical protein
MECYLRLRYEYFAGHIFGLISSLNLLDTFLFYRYFSFKIVCSLIGYKLQALDISLPFFCLEFEKLNVSVI